MRSDFVASGDYYMALTVSSGSCDLTPTLGYEEIHHRGLTPAKCGWFWKTLLNIASEVKSNKTLEIERKLDCVTQCDHFMAFIVSPGLFDQSHSL